MSDTNTNSDTDSGSSYCQTLDNNGEAANGITIVGFERKLGMAEEIKCGLADNYDRIDILTHHGDMFANHWGEYDCFVGLMASGIAIWKTAGLPDDRWEDSAVVVVDKELTWTTPLTGGHHDTNRVTHNLPRFGAVPAMTTVLEAVGKQGVKNKAKAFDSHVVNGDSTVTTNPAVLDDEPGPVAQLDGSKAVLIGDDMTVLKRNGGGGAVLETGGVSGAKKAQFLVTWEQALDNADCNWDDVDLIAAGTRKADKSEILDAAEEVGVGVVYLERETLTKFKGPTLSRLKELIGWPGIAEASAIAGGRDHELVVEKRCYDDAVTVAVRR